MQQHHFLRLDLTLGWILFLLSATVYMLTLEPTASLWDCSEFIACGYKLEIGHPPGAPFFMLTSNLFSQLAGSPSEVAYCINMLSALLSAGCILFLFWTITHSARKMLLDGDVYPTHKVLLVEACGVMGALTYAFSDTFWFSAVEGEVYAYSSFLTALICWLILKWEDEPDSYTQDRWMILIAYVTGLSIGVHLLCLLCIPAMALVVYYRKTSQRSGWGVTKALFIGFGLIGIILYGIVPGVTIVGGWFELLFVNHFHLPYHVGVGCYLLLMMVGFAVAFLVISARRTRLPIVCLLMLLVGYSTYAVIYIRSAANPPLDENSPDYIFALRSYLGREQYGETPLLYGPAYTSRPAYEEKGEYLIPKMETGDPVYQPSPRPREQRYVVVRNRNQYLYQDNMWFPRMHSDKHAQAYEQWMGGVKKKENLPTMAENIRFLFSYQVQFMYWRYFLWNFVGRQNNIQGHGEVEHGNWITGFDCIDRWLLHADMSQLPTDLKQNRGRNVFYGIPLIMGLLGIWWLTRQGQKGEDLLGIIFLLFLMTGLAIVFYLNQTPLQPRERDYAYAGSFYAFAIWIGMGTAALYEGGQKIVRREGWATGMAGLMALLIPLQVVSQTWDDHDRSGRYACRDFGFNYLESLQSSRHPIIFTNGDNETFPLWYAQEVEGKRIDTRVCNLSYLQTDWYIDQMKRPAYDAPALPISWSREEYQEGTNEYVPIRPELKAEVMALYASQPTDMKQRFGDQPFEVANLLRNWVRNPLSSDFHCIPTDTVYISRGESRMVISLRDIKGLYKSDLMVLEMLANSIWDRPMYTAIGLGSSNLPFLRDHLVLEGMAYRIVPDAVRRQIDVEALYDRIVHQFRYGGLSQPGRYMDTDMLQMAQIHQQIMGQLIDGLLEKGDTQRAAQVVQLWKKELPVCNVPYTSSALSMARYYYVTRQTSQGDEIVQQLLTRSQEWLSWLLTISPSKRQGSSRSISEWMDCMHQTLSLSVQYDRNQLTNQYLTQYEHYIKAFSQE